MKPRVVTLTTSSTPIRIISESFNDALGEVNSDDNFAKHALMDYEEEDIANLTDEQISNLVDDASETYEEVMADFNAPSYFDADPDMRSNFDNDEFSMASGKRADKKAKRRANRVARKEARVEKIKAKREIAKARIQSKNDKKALRQLNRKARRGDRKAAKDAKRLAHRMAIENRKTAKAQAKAERRAIRKGGSADETPTDEMQDGATTNEAGTADNGNMQDTGATSEQDTSSDNSGGGDEGAAQGGGQGGAYPETDGNSAPEMDADNSGEDGGSESQAGEDENQEPVATDDGDSIEETDGFNGLDADALGTDTFANEIMSETNGGKRKRNRTPRKEKRMNKKAVGGGYAKNGDFVPANKDQSQTDMQLEIKGQSEFDGDDFSSFNGSAIKGINWRMVGVGAVLAVAGIWAIRKFKLIK